MLFSVRIMNKFSFKLEGILSIRLKLEEQAKMEFGNARARLNEEEEKLDGLENRKLGYENEMREVMLEKLDVKKINSLHAAIEVMKDKIKTQKLAVKRAENQVELARIRLNTAVQERKTIEKLKEKEFEEYMKEYNAEESKQVDELVSYRFGSAEQ